MKTKKVKIKFSKKTIQKILEISKFEGISNNKAVETAISDYHLAAVWRATLDIMK